MRAPPQGAMGAFLRFIKDMDASARRAVIVTLILFAAILALLAFGRSGGFGAFDGAFEALERVSKSPLGPVGLIAVYVIGAYVGAPQFGLHAGAVLVFGPALGGLYAWSATVCSGTATFWTGRWAGEESVRRYAGPSANRLSAFIGRNAFLASALVRNVPTAPFIIVNMAFGVSRARYWPFIAGLALGSSPKIALVAFAGQSVFAALAGRPLIAAAAALAVAAGLIALASAGARVLRRLSKEDSNAQANSVDTRDDFG